MKRITRRGFMATTAGIGASAAVLRYAKAAEFNYKLATDLVPTDMAAKLIKEACDEVNKETNGRLEIRFFPNSQLGGPMEELGQIKSGALEMYFVAYAQISPVVPACAIINMAFVFDDREVAHKAIDGELGTFFNAEAAKANMIVITRANDAGFRNLITGTRQIKEPGEIKGFKLRVPAVPILTSLFTAFGAATTVIPANELYTALQTKLVDGHENSLLLMLNYRGYEVQKYVTFTNHAYDAWFVTAGREAWEKLPADLQAIMKKHFDNAMVKHRVESERAQKAAEEFCASKGMVFYTPEKGLFRKALQKTDYYPTWKAKFGNEAWSVVQRSTGTDL